MKKGRILQVIGVIIILFFFVNVVVAYVESTNFGSGIPIPTVAVSFTPADTLNAENANSGPILAAVTNSFENPTYISQPVASNFPVLNPGTVKEADLRRALTDSYYGPKGSQSAIGQSVVTKFAADYSPATMARFVYDNYGANGITDANGNTYKNFPDFYAAVASSTDYASTVANTYGFGWKLDCSAGGCANGQTTGTQFTCACKYWGAGMIGAAIAQSQRAVGATPNTPSSAQIYGEYAKYGYDPTQVINGIALGFSGTGASTGNVQVDPTFYGNNYLKVGFGIQPEYIIDGNGNAILISGTGANTFAGPSTPNPTTGIWAIVSQNGGISAIQGGSARGIVIPESVARAWGAQLCHCDANSDAAIQAARAEVTVLEAAGKVVVEGWIVSDNYGDCSAAANAGGGCIPPSAWKASIQAWQSLSPYLKTWNAQNPASIIEWGWAPYSSGVPGFTSISTPTMWDSAWDTLMYPIDSSMYQKLSSCTGAGCGTSLVNDKAYLTQLWATVKLNGWLLALPNAPGYPQPPSSFTGTNVPYPTLGCQASSCATGAKYTNYFMNGVYMQLMRLVSNPPSWATQLGFKACTGDGCITFEQLNGWVETSVQESQAVKQSKYDGLAGILAANAIMGTDKVAGIIGTWQSQGCWTGKSCGEPGTAASETWAAMMGLGHGWQQGQGGWSFTQVQDWAWGTLPNGQPGGYGWAPDPSCPSGGNCGTYGAYASNNPLAQMFEMISSYNEQYGLPNIPDMMAVVFSTPQNLLNFQSYVQCRAAGLSCGYSVSPSGVFVVDPPPGTPATNPTPPPPPTPSNPTPTQNEPSTPPDRSCVGCVANVPPSSGITHSPYATDSSGNLNGCLALASSCDTRDVYSGIQHENLKWNGGSQARNCLGIIESACAALIPVTFTGPDGNLYAYFPNAPSALTFLSTGLSPHHPQLFDVTGQIFSVSIPALSYIITIGSMTMLTVWIPILLLAGVLIVGPVMLTFRRVALLTGVVLNVIVWWLTQNLLYAGLTFAVLVSIAVAVLLLRRRHRRRRR